MANTALRGGLNVPPLAPIQVASTQRCTCDYDGDTVCDRCAQAYRDSVAAAFRRLRAVASVQRRPLPGQGVVTRSDREYAAYVQTLTQHGYDDARR